MPHGAPPATQIFPGDVHAEQPYEQWLEETAPDLSVRAVLDKVAQRCFAPDNMTCSHDHLVQAFMDEGVCPIKRRCRGW